MNNAIYRDIYEFHEKFENIKDSGKFDEMLDCLIGLELKYAGNKFTTDLLCAVRREIERNNGDI